MPRNMRFSPPGSVHHVMNRGNDKKILFESPRDFEEFLLLVAWAKQQSLVRIVAYCLMSNHWHFVLWPSAENQVTTFLHRLTTTHAIRRRRRTGTVGYGHVYKDRYRASGIWSEAYYWNVLRYVESNPLRAHLVKTSAEWQWSSLYERLNQSRQIVDEGPAPLPENWSLLVDQSLPESIEEEIHRSLRKH